MSNSIEKKLMCPLTDEIKKSCKGWDKETIEYVLKHRDSVMSYIYRILASRRKKTGGEKLAVGDPVIDDIFSDLLIYLCKAEDYSLASAIEKSKSGLPVPIKGYICNCINNVIKRYICKENNIFMYEQTNNVVKKDNDSSEDTFDIFEKASYDKYMDGTSLIEDTEDITENLIDLCECFIPYRYKYGTDFYQLMYVRLLTFGDEETYKKIINALGIDQRVLRLTNREFMNNSQSSESVEAVTDLISAITKVIANSSSMDEPIRILKKYVYCADIIEKTIEMIRNDVEEDSRYI